MTSRIKFQILGQNRIQWAIYLVIIVSLFSNCLNQFLYFPHFIRYVADFCIIILLFLIVLNNKSNNSQEYKILLGLIIIFFTYCACVYAFKFQSFFYFLWGVRNLFRMYVLLLSCILFLDENNINGYFKLFDIVFILNAVLTVIQYATGYIRDNLSGIFGVLPGGNGYTNVYFCLVSIICLVKLFQGQISKCKAYIYFAIMFLLAALEELKAFYIEFLIIILIVVLASGFSWRKLLIAIPTIAEDIIGICILLSIFPTFQDVFSLNGMYTAMSSDSGYTGSGDINRLNIISQINNRFFKSSLDCAFGFGLGNCDYSSNFEFVTSPFFMEYESFHYMWFSYASIYLETGLFGLTLYFGIFGLTIILMLFKLMKKRGNKTYVLISHIRNQLGSTSVGANTCGKQLGPTNQYA